MMYLALASTLLLALILALPTISQRAAKAGIRDGVQDLYRARNEYRLRFHTESVEI